jgi:IS30 family transposase
MERVTRFYVMIKIQDRRSDTVLRAMCSYRDMVGKDRFGSVFRSVTFDNGIEFSKWREMERELGTVTYFGRPYHSCDRGSNENCNGLIRKYIRKETDINEVSSSETRRINMAINGKHRRILGYESVEHS